MPKVIPTAPASEAPTASDASASALGKRAPRVAVDRSRITFADTECVAKVMSIDGVPVATLYKSERGTIARCNDRSSLPAMAGIFEIHPTEKDKDGDPVVTLDKLTAWTAAGMAELWGKEAKPLSSAQKEYKDLLILNGTSREDAERKARKL